MAWWLLHEELNGTMEETYPTKDALTDEEVNDIYQYHYPNVGINTGDDIKHSEYYYDYDRNGDMPDLFSSDPLSDNDDQIAHHISGLNNEVEKQGEEKPMANYFKYHEEEILKDIGEYVSRTYQGHYTGNSHEFRNVQTLDLMAAKELASGFCQANILKYGSRYGNKDGRNTKDLMKVIHYAMLLLHFDGHYGKPSMSTGNIDAIDQNMP